MRKVSLFNGDEKLYSFHIRETESKMLAYSAINGEFSRNPFLTHAEFRDNNGKIWNISRADMKPTRFVKVLLAK